MTRDLLGGATVSQADISEEDAWLTFRKFTRIFHAAYLLELATGLPLAPERSARLRALLELAEPTNAWTAEELAAFDVARFEAETKDILGSLRNLVDRS